MPGKPDIDEVPRIVPEAVIPARAGGPGRGPWAGVIAVLVVVLIGYLFTKPPEPRLDWREGTPPRPGLNVESLIVTAEGFAILAGPGESGGRVWSTVDGDQWTERTLPRLSARIVYHQSGLFVVDGPRVSRIGPDADDTIVEVGLPAPVRIGNGSDRSGLVAVLDGLLAQTVDGDFYWSPEGRVFDLVVPAAEWRAESDVTLSPRVVPEVVRQRVRSVCQPAARRAPDIPPVVSAADEVVVFVAQDDSSIIWPACEPILWASADGITWHPRSEESPFPSGAYLHDVAWRDGRFVAVGGIGLDEAHAWTSVDGDTWEELELPTTEDQVDLTDIEAGGLGWVLTADPRDGGSRTGWYSADAECWERLPLGVGAEKVAVGEDRILLANRSGDAVIWVGTESGSRGFLRRCA